MNSILLIAGVTVRDILRRYVIYIALFISGLTFLSTFASLSFMRMALDAGEQEMVERMQRQSIQGVFGTWSFFGTVLSVYLGSIMISSETRTRTILSVLSRPIPRWKFLAGKCLGVQIFFLFFMAVGILSGLGLSLLYGVTPSPIFWLALAEIFVNVFLLSGVSLGLSAFLPPVFAGGIALLLIYFAPGLGEHFMKDPNPLFGWPGAAAFYIAPANMPIDLVEASLTRDLLDPKLGLYSRILLENALYAIAVMACGSWIFARRDVPLK